uniref:Uncharacterized protein n=1 Tax=Cacopsylla melanoneura TaxID=428564 RepID=A0A8D8S4Z4_9HEMI
MKPTNSIPLVEDNVLRRTLNQMKPTNFRHKLKYRLTIVVDVFSFSKVGDSWRVSKAILLGHQFVVTFDDLDSVLCRFIVYQFNVSQDSGIVRIIFDIKHHG